MSQQLSFWDEPKTETTEIWQAVTDLKMKQNHLRRGLFQRLEDLVEEIGILKAEVNTLKYKESHEEQSRRSLL